MSAVLHAVSPGIAERPAHPDFIFICPGCKFGHGVWTSKAAHNGARWTWNGDMVRPTFSPSLLITMPRPPESAHVCHSYVQDGQIQFLSDCTHELAGKTVPLEPF